jgi:hypothetical protein
MSRGRIIDCITVERAMSETSQSVGRIAVLTAFTLVFAAAWRGDAHESSRPATVLAWTKRGSGSAVHSDSSRTIADGLTSGRTQAVRDNLPARVNGLLLSTVARRSPAPLFSGTPALLGRSTLPISEDVVTTAAAGPEQAR